MLVSRNQQHMDILTFKQRVLPSPSSDMTGGREDWYLEDIPHNLSVLISLRS